MKNMKNIWVKVALPTIVGLAITSCSDFLDVDPLTMVTEDNFWDEKNDVDEIVTGCYTRMQESDFCKRLFIWGEVRSDNVAKGDDNLSSTSDENYILTENILATNGYTDWSSFYAVIDRCNLVIEKAPEVAEIDPSYLESEVNATIAEVSALRALCYFYLVRTFKDVPYYTYAITNDEQDLELPATDGDAIIDSCIADLEDVQWNALSAWPKVNGQDISYGRITQDAIHALLADMYLWRENYSQAAYYAQLVIDSKQEYFEDNYSSNYNVDGYPLIPDYSSGGVQSSAGAAYNAIFGTGGSAESIFELDFSDDVDEKWNDAVADFFYGTVDDATEVGIFGPSEPLLSEYSSQSLFYGNSTTEYRLRESIYADDESSATDGGQIAKYTYETIDPTKEHGDNSSNTDRSSKDDANWIFYRTSDMMLIRAEALICQMSDNDTLSTNDQALRDEALELIQAIEDRSSSSGTASISDATSSKSDMFDLVYDARRREFLFEGKRWFDLVRRSRKEGDTDYLVDQVKEKYTENSSVATSKLGNMNAIYWPYNDDELDVNPNLTQNPAYPDEGSSYESTR